MTLMDKLEESGLDEKDAEILKFKYLEKESPVLADYGLKPHAGILIPYFDHEGNPAFDTPGAKPFVRFRNYPIGEIKEYKTKSKSGKEGTQKASFTKSKVQRYQQPSKTKPLAYWPLNWDWTPLLDNVDIPLILTEGEFKAVKACKEGFPTLAFGGCHNWHLAKRDHELLPSLDVINFFRRKVYLCFDSDYVNNKDMCRGLSKLSQVLAAKGAEVFIITLPILQSGKKTGLDDFLVYHGTSGQSQFKNQIEVAQPFTDMQKLFDMNERLCIVGAKSCIVDSELDTMKSKNDFITYGHGSRQNIVTKMLPPKIKDNGELEFKKKERKLAEAWFEWYGAAYADDAGFRPGADNIYYETRGQQRLVIYNLWRGYPVKEKKGDVSLFLRYIDHLMINHTDYEKKWLIQWLAAPFQKSSIGPLNKRAPLKMMTAVILFSSNQGTGKTLLGDIMMEVYGKRYAVPIGEKELRNTFNGTYALSQFVISDEINGLNNRSMADRLKDIITNKQVNINVKYGPQFRVDTYTQYVFTTNHRDAFYIEDKDRRYFVVAANEERMTQSFADKVLKWIRSKKGKAALLHYFLKEVDLTGFEPYGAAPVTHAKRDMIEATESDIDAWIRTLIEYPDTVISIDKGDLLSAEEIKAAYDPIDNNKITPRGVTNKLKNKGFLQVHNGKIIRTNRKATRYFIIRNKDKWLNASYDEIKDYLIEKEGKDKLPKF